MRDLPRMVLNAGFELHRVGRPQADGGTDLPRAPALALLD
jgi:hypothetical protein